MEPWNGAGTEADGSAGPHPGVGVVDVVLLGGVDVRCFGMGVKLVVCGRVRRMWLGARLSR